VQAGRTPEELAREFEPSAQTIARALGAILLSFDRRTCNEIVVVSFHIMFLLTHIGSASGQRDVDWVANVYAVSYQTGNEVNCPTGAGIGADIEHRWGRVVSIGLGVGFRLADAMVCTSVGTSRQVNGRWLDEFGHLSLIAAPVLHVSGGTGRSFGAMYLAGRVRAGTVLARVDGPADDRLLTQMTQLEFSANDRLLGVVFRFGVVRSPLLLETAESGQWEVVDREWYWRRIVELGLAFAW
jgi:hypothetical protein